MSYLIDSDWIIDALAPRSEALALLRSLRPDGLAVSIVTLGELFDGAVGSPDPDAALAAIRGFLSGYAVMDLSDPIMEVFARRRTLLRRQGRLIPDLDLLIAATALVHDLTLVTRNRRHSARIPALRLYGPAGG